MILLLLMLAGEDPAELLARAIPREAEIVSAARNYLYTEEKSDQQIDRQGRPGKTEYRTFEIIPLEGEHYRKLVMIDGKPLSGSAQKKVEADVEKTRRERQKERRLTLTRVERRVKLNNSLEKLAEEFENSVTREETASGRLCWIVDSMPRDPSTPWRHRSWIEKETGIRVQWTDTALRDVNGIKAGSTFTFRRDTGTEQTWLLREVISDVELSAYRVIHGRVHTVQRFVNFRKFDVSSTITIR